MEMWDLRLENIKKICRICLEEHNAMNNIYQNENIYQMSIAELLSNFLSLKIEEDEELPSLICNQCETEVFQFCEFKLKLDKSSKYLQEYLTQLDNTNTDIEHGITIDQDSAENNVVIIEYPSENVEILSDAEITIDGTVVEVVEEFSDNEIEVEQKKVIKAKKKPKKIDEEKHNSYICKKCNETFDSKIKLTVHLRKLLHYSQKTVTCSQCKLLVPVQNYKGHFLKHSSDFRCEICGKVFSNNFNLKRHLYVHTKQTPFSCDLCGAKFARQDKLKSHLMTHSYEVPFTCDACGQRFRRKSALVQHQEKYCSGEQSEQKYKRSLSCDICSKSFALSSSLRTHKLLHTDDRVICGTCGKPYPNEKKLSEHKLLVHAKKKGKEFLCNFCAKQYSNKGLLQRHILTHLGLSKSYKCKVCNKSFTQSGSLALHLKIHTGEKPFVCHVCSKAFNKPSNLQRHLRCHDNIRPYVCPVCEKCFGVKQSLIVHTRIHTGEKPFECSICSKKFVDRSSLTKHIKTHSRQN